MAAGVPVRCEGAACRARAAVGRQPTTQHSEPPGSCFPAVSAIAEHRDALSMHAVPQPKGSQPRTLRALVPPEAPVAAVHEHVGSDGGRTELKKTRGGDQGDALTTLIFPLAYKRVRVHVHSAVADADPKARVYTYQDDMEAVCSIEAISQANAAYGSVCAQIGLRANLGKTRVAPGRGPS